MPAIADGDRVLARAELMLKAAVELGLHVTVSEQYPKGLGPTVAGLMGRVADPDQVEPASCCFEKLAFSVCGDPTARRRLTGLMRPQVIIVGVEAHVCVQQTALELLDMQMRPYVLADAVGSRRSEDRQIALDRMRTAGVTVTTVESAIFEVLREASGDLFKRLHGLVK